jgi:glycerate kinase
MRVLNAPDKFKDCLPAQAVAHAIAAGLQAQPHASQLDRDLDLCPMTDGGDGFLDAISTSFNNTPTPARIVTTRVVGPLAEMSVDASYAVAGDLGVIEMARASGLALLAPADRHPFYTTTFGTGQLMRHAVQFGCRRILLGVGGSATNDAGVGCLQACGAHIILRSGEYARDTEPLRAIDLPDILLIKSHRGSPLDGVEVTIASDVTNPLYGPTGAAHTFARQKGAADDDVLQLDQWTRDLSARLAWDEFARMPGSGAAGGIGFGLRACFGATLQSGFDIAARAVDLDARIARADLIITGEGALDASSFSGKVVGRIATRARSLGKRCIAIVGTITQASTPSQPSIEVIELRSLAGSKEDSIRHAKALLCEAARRISFA